jgi:hypothetical protein
VRGGGVVSRSPIHDPQPWDRLCPGPGLRETWRAITWTDAPPLVEVLERSGSEVVISTVPEGRRCCIALARWAEIAHGSWLP